jgi:hypothetical protein
MGPVREPMRLYAAAPTVASAASGYGYATRTPDSPPPDRRIPPAPTCRRRGVYSRVVSRPSDSGAARSPVAAPSVADRAASLVAAGEGTEVEFKVRLPPGRRVLRTLCAFANTRGGTLLVGVTDGGRVRGVENPREVVRRLSELSSHGADPPIPVRIELARLEGGCLVVCSVPESDRRPHRIVGVRGGGPLVRVGASNRTSRERDLRALERRPPRESELSKLERTALEWVRRRTSRSDLPDGRTTADRFAREHNLGRPRARRSLEHLLRDGFVVAHGHGSQRFFAPV